MSDKEFDIAVYIDFMREITGQEAVLVGENTLRSAIRGVMEREGVRDPRTLLERLRADSSKLQSFINTVTISESWFFRDEAPFQFFARYCQGWIARGRPGERIDVLSLPCAGGEEAYSVAITAHRAGLGPQHCHVDALDISTEALARAERGFYTAHAFRGVDAPQWGEYFQPVEGGFAVQAWLKNYVTFWQGSVLEADSRLAGSRYDVIFFRNLLIYLGGAARQRALQVVASLLKPQGVLLVGHAETGLTGPDFAADGDVHHFAFRRKASAANAPLLAPTPATCAPVGTRALPAGEGRGRFGDSALETGYTSVVSEVEQLANEGKLGEARRRCGWLLAETPEDPQVCYLCAVVAEAEGDAGGAEELLRRALAQSPEHYPALVHLAATLEVRGAKSEADELRARAQDLAEQGKAQP
jgi:chemotaxis protein methyltransferase WspC